MELLPSAAFVECRVVDNGTHGGTGETRIVPAPIPQKSSPTVKRFTDRGPLRGVHTFVASGT